MKRIHLFEFEDFPWFPGFLRDLMTRYINAMHRLLGSAPELANLVSKALEHAQEKKVIDLCSGGGGPMPEVADALRKEAGLSELQLSLSDLYPNRQFAAEIAAKGEPKTTYLTKPVDATHLETDQKGVRTMICSLHHMKPAVAQAILADAQKANQPIVVFEISDNSYPKWIWWLTIPINLISVLLITPLVRPMTWQQLVFTYLIPILPILIAWDGAVSNARTYTLEDLDILLADLKGSDYSWEKGVIKGKGNKLFLMGLPAQKQVKTTSRETTSN